MLWTLWGVQGGYPLPRHVFWPRAMGMILSQKLLARYRELKQDVPDCLLLMQVGAFIQVMGEDTRAVSEVAGLTLQMPGRWTTQ
jgi:MutS domain I